MIAPTVAQLQKTQSTLSIAIKHKINTIQLVQALHINMVDSGNECYKSMKSLSILVEIAWNVWHGLFKRFKFFVYRWGNITFLDIKPRILRSWENSRARKEITAAKCHKTFHFMNCNQTRLSFRDYASIITYCYTAIVWITLWRLFWNSIPRYFYGFIQSQLDWYIVCFIIQHVFLRIKCAYY